MNKSSSHAFINKLLVYLLLTIGFNGSVGLGTVWYRHQISVTARETKVAEIKLAAVERRLAEINSRLAAEQAPDMLEQKNISMALNLVQPLEDHIVRIEESPEERLARKRNREIFATEPSADYAAVRFVPAERQPL